MKSNVKGFLAMTNDGVFGLASDFHTYKHNDVIYITLIYSTPDGGWVICSVANDDVLPCPDDTQRKKARRSAIGYINNERNSLQRLLTNGLDNAEKLKSMLADLDTLEALI